MKIRLLFTYSVVNYMYIFVTFEKLPPQWQLFNSLLFSPESVAISIALKKKDAKVSQNISICILLYIPGVSKWFFIFFYYYIFFVLYLKGSYDAHFPQVDIIL